jgi:hypothetical protein
MPGMPISIDGSQRLLVVSMRRYISVNVKKLATYMSTVEYCAMKSRKESVRK